MKRIFASLAIILIAGSLYAQSPTSFGKKIVTMPVLFEKPNEKTDINHTGKSSSLPWIVFSDRNENYSYTTPGGSLIMKKLNFMEPFYVSTEANGYVKLIKYEEGMVRGRKLNDRKKAKSYGWVSKSKLLLWQGAFCNAETGFPLKAIAIINGKEPLSEPKYFFDNTDSLLVYNSPELKQRQAKVRLHEIVYVFKKSDDGKKVLIGSQDQLIADSAKKSIYGWVSASAISYWGDRLYIATNSTKAFEQSDSLQSFINQRLRANQNLFQVDPLLPTDQPLLRSLPVLSENGQGSNNNELMSVGVASDVFNKTQNYIINIKGGSLSFKEYLNIRKNSRKINVVFVIDGGTSMYRYFPGLTNTIQTFENAFNGLRNNNKLNFGAVVYRSNTSCNTQGLAQLTLDPDYRKLVTFLSQQATVTAKCGNEVTTQPVAKGLRASLDMFANHQNETNLVVLLGSTGDENESYDQTALTDMMTNTDARLLAIQVYSDFDPLFNNFVIQSRKLVSESAIRLANKKKTRMVKGEGLTSFQPFNTALSDSISFFLDYPVNSLVQGGVVFPTKGSVKSNQSMEMAIRRFLNDTDRDINGQINALDSAFRYTGRERKKLSWVVESQLQAPIDDHFVENMPHNAFKYYSTAGVPKDLVSSNPNWLQYMVVLNNMEFKQQTDIYSLMIGENIQPDQPNFRKRLFKNYVSALQNLMDVKISKSDIKKLTLSAYLQKVSGLPVSTPLLVKYHVGDLKQKNKMSQPEFESYISYLMNCTQSIKKAAQIDQQFISNGKTYYYITQDNWIMPIITARQ